MTKDRLKYKNKSQHKSAKYSDRCYQIKIWTKTSTDTTEPAQDPQLKVKKNSTIKNLENICFI